MEIQLSTYKEIFEKFPDIKYNGFLVRGTKDDQRLESLVSEFMKICFAKGFVYIDNPWAAIYKIATPEGKLDVCFIAEDVRHINVIKWSSLSNYNINGISLGEMFAWVSDAREFFQK